MLKTILKSSRRYSTLKKFKDEKLIVPVENPLKSLDGTKNYPTSDLDNWTSKLEAHEIKARIYKVLRKFDIDLFKFNFDSDFERDLKWDTFEAINFVTCCEHEFHCVFEENVFDNMENCQNISDYLVTTTRAF